MNLYRRFYMAMLPHAGDYALEARQNIKTFVCYLLVMILPLPKGRES